MPYLINIETKNGFAKNTKTTRRNLMWIKNLAAAATVSFVLSGAAFAASDQSNVGMCMNALNAATAAERNVDVKFKSLSGGGVQKIAFEVNASGDKRTVVCKIKRGEVIALDWKGGAPAYASR